MIKKSTAATVGNMACGGVKSDEAGKISCEAYQSEMKINVNLLNFTFVLLKNFYLDIAR